MMKKKLFIFLLTLITYSTYAQNSIILKLYHNSDFFKVKETTSYDILVENEFQTSFKRISVGVQFFKSNKWFHEIEFSLSNNITPLNHHYRNLKQHNLKTDYYSFQYEINKAIKPDRGLTKFSIGLGLNSYWNKLDQIPIPFSNFFPFYQRNIGSTLNFIPRVRFEFSPRLQLDVNAKLGILDVREYALYIDNKQTPEKHKFSAKEIQLDFLPSLYNIRIGVSYKIK